MGAGAVLLALGGLLGGPPAAFPDAASLNEAAGLYHQARFDSARVRLEGLFAAEGWRRRDSLVLLQYLGMAEARLGAESLAVERFDRLLAVDSLFRFPRNEDPAVLRAFLAAQARRRAPPPIPATPADATEPPATGQLLVAAAPPANPLRAPPTAEPDRRMSLALGAVPMGGGWLARRRTSQGLALGFLQAGGLLLSLYASERQSGLEDDGYGLQGSERGGAVGWQWVQRISLSTALGAYFFSLIAAGGE